MSTPQLDAPLYPPLYGASFGQAVKRFFKKYAVFSGRASRSEYWWWWLFGVIVNAVFFLIGSLTGTTSVDTTEGFSAATLGNPVVTVIQSIWGLAILIPGLALLFRRLHDTNRSGWWWLILLVPLAGPIIMLVFLIGDSRPEGARFDTQ
ncbi:DUF805 domain-containing protein [Pseudoclavibacter sp. RFBJ3]|uniref:DUF805 domain-containing protein n=1 Tax=unclassified Pseudoclavibacter TaxID=2615177 RepID=UPI000CE80299|nr:MULTISPECIES: DUF805 domain-containing protein [unclassified Pseudoclavibacter]MBF4550040.1 DUF805 domain-containing protein [Pseudoclavibacter sp. VKM Ac-2888]PPF74842.1 DUF805 domain-containing protein [Pseudoclavibacter sp. Z016]PPF83867.1 DUF805 domain-containing protein [Pseudoclavibacter sp. RFBJ5]PPF92147.1 DUF805 domain-containing protein [Pseudoclavibacter sp. RFBJ3]PPF97010.1 DUF805 domain-containing protein [Pseudoclavibacter sp. RFBH5]